MYSYICINKVPWLKTLKYTVPKQLVPKQPFLNRKITVFIYINQLFLKKTCIKVICELILQQFKQSHGVELLLEDIEKRFLRYPVYEIRQNFINEGEAIQKRLRVPVSTPQEGLIYRQGVGVDCYFEWGVWRYLRINNQNKFLTLLFLSPFTTNPLTKSGRTATEEQPHSPAMFDYEKNYIYLLAVAFSVFCGNGQHTYLPRNHYDSW